MNNLRKVIILLVGILLSGAAMAQRAESLCFEKRYTFYFRVNSDELDDDYMGNSETKGLMYKEIGTRFWIVVHKVWGTVTKNALQLSFFFLKLDLWMKFR